MVIRVTCVCLLVVAHICLVTSSLNRTSYSSLETRDQRLYNPIINVINFENGPCTGTATSLTGICYSSSECSGISGGYADGRCAAGFGVCCVIRTSACGGTISQNSTHIQNPGYPEGYTDSTSCVYTFQKLTTDICAIRLDYVQFVTRGPDVDTSPYTVCSHDTMTFTTPSAYAPPTICGYETGHHIYLDSSRGSLTTNPVMTLAFTGTTFSRYWQIRVDQIPCGTLYTPPQGCLEYHMDTYGNFKSFNFGLNDADYHSLGTQDYSVCIRRNSGMCKVAYKAAEDGESFYTSQKPTTPAIRSKAGEKGCPADYLNIPNGSNSEHGGGMCTSPAPVTTSHLGRFCGRRLNCYTNSASNTEIYSSFLPFIVMVDFNGAEASADNKNRGFSIDYRQIKC